MNKRTILLYGRSRAGKSTLIGELAEDIFKKTGKRTRLYTADKGGSDPVAPYISLGVIEPIELAGSDPWMFSSKAAGGFVRDGEGKWVKGDLSGIGLIAYESMTSLADAFMENLAERSANGESFGGQANVSFRVQDGDDTLKIGGANMAHYNIVQTRITSEVWKSQKLDVPIILWTAGVSKDDDTVSAGKVLGPAVVGKALTGEVPRWFNLTFRVDCLPATAGKPERHIIYLGNSQDLQAGNATSLGNTRVPLDAPVLPSSLEPASLVRALELIDGGHTAALATIKSRLKTS